MNSSGKDKAPSISQDEKRQDFYNRYFKGEFSNLPKYLQLREVLFAAILDGYWKSEDKLPPEAVLAEHSSYSLGTVQKALGLLAEEGIIIRRHGHGTYVADNLVAPRHCRLIGADLRHVLPVYPRLISRELTTGTLPWATYLGEQGKNFVSLDRILDVNHEFLVFNRFQLNRHKYPIFWELPEDKLDGVNFKHLLKNTYNTVITMSSNYVGQQTFSKEICHHLMVPSGTIGLHLEVLARNSRGEAVYFYDLYIPPTSCRLHISDFQTLEI